MIKRNLYAQNWLHCAKGKSYAFNSNVRCKMFRNFSQTIKLNLEYSDSEIGHAIWINLENK